MHTQDIVIGSAFWLEKIALFGQPFFQKGIVNHLEFL